MQGQSGACISITCGEKQALPVLSVQGQDDNFPKSLVSTYRANNAQGWGIRHFTKIKKVTSALEDIYL